MRMRILSKSEEQLFDTIEKKDDAKAVGSLLDSGADIEVRQMINWQTPLMCASEKDRVAIVSLLLDRGADVFATDLSGKTALNHAESEKTSEPLKNAALKRMSPGTLPRE